MKIYRLVGVVDRVESGIVAVVPQDNSRELYIALESLPGAREGMEVNCVVELGKGPNDLCKVLGKKNKKPLPPPKMKSFSILLKAMDKSMARLKARLAELESQETPDLEEIDTLKEKIRFLEKGMGLFQ